MTSTANFPWISMKSKAFQMNGIKIVVLLLSLAQITWCLTSRGVTFNDGVSSDLRPSYLRLDGTNGIKAPLDSRQGSNMDYTIKLWFRSQRNQNQLGQQSETLVQIPGVITCGLQQSNKLACNSSSNSNGIILDTTGLNSQMWVHLTVSGGQNAGVTYIRLDYADQIFSIVNTTYISMSQSASSWNAYLGINSSLQAGFVGDIREFFFAQQYTAQSTIPYIKNQILTWDPTQIAYYRFNNGSLADSFRHLTAANIYLNSKSQALSMSDNLPNDMCYAFQSYSQISALSIGVEDGSISSGTLDSRYKKDQTSYQYTLSMWLSTKPGISTTSSATTGRNSVYFFSLDQSFTLWFTDDTHFAIYFLGNPTYSETYSSPVFIPMGQFVNIQISIDRVKGYTINVYDLQRRLISSVTSAKYLPAQIPAGTFALVNGFKGYVKSIMVYQNKQTLPITHPIGASTTITDDNLIIYYNFDKANFIGRTLQSLAISSSGLGRGPMVTFLNAITFEYVKWDESYSYSAPGTIGTLSQTTSLFDGIACKDQNMTVNLQTNSSYIQYDSLYLNNSINQATVELWFKRKAQINATNYLFSMYSSVDQNQYFSIYQNASDNNLTCAPFPSQSSQKVLLSAVSPTTLVWQHVACTITQTGQIQGFYDNVQGSSSFYVSSIPTTIISLPVGKYSIIIGNNYNKTAGSSNTYYKEVRFWTSSRNSLQVSQYLYQQFDPTNDVTLVAYFRMESGTYSIQNYPSIDQQNATLSNGISLASENTLTVCPLYAYYNMYGTGGCYQNPFYKQYIHVLSVPISAYPYVEFHLTSQYSDVVSPSALTNVNYTWTSLDQPSQSLYVSSQANNSTIVLPAGSNGVFNDYPYTILQSTTNNQTTFQSLANQTFTFQSCRWIGDSSTKAPTKDIILNSTRGSSDISFSFNVYNVQGQQCSDSTKFLYLQNSTSVLVTPSQLNITNITQSAIITSTAQGFSIVIPASEQSKFTMDSFVNIIFTVYWSNDPLLNTSLSYLNIVYRIKFVTNIMPVISTSQSIVFMGDQLTLLGSNSYITSIVDPVLNKAGLLYQWSCPSIFQQACQNLTNSPVMLIPYSQFVSAGAKYSTNYTFTLAVWRNVDLDSSAAKTVSANVMWVNVASPNYNLIINQGTNKVLVTQTNTFSVSLSNYDSNNASLIYTWKFTPEILSPSINKQISSDLSTLTVLQGGFAFNTLYSLSVSIQQGSYPTSIQSKSFNFQTLTPPTPGNLTITPSNGTALSTLYTISLDNWTTLYPPIVYKFYGMTSSGSVYSYLTSNWVDGTRSYSTYLPQMTSFVASVTDQSYETTQVTQNLSVVGDPNTNWTISIANIVSYANGNVQLKYDTLAMLVQEMNQYVNSGVQNSVNINDRTTILGLLINDTTNLTNSSNSNQTVILIQEAIKMLPLLTAEVSLLNSTLVNQTMNILQAIKVPTMSYQVASIGSDFKANYANTINNLMTYTLSSIASIQSTRRMLQQDEVNSILVDMSNNDNDTSTSSDPQAITTLSQQIGVDSSNQDQLEQGSGDSNITNVNSSADSNSTSNTTTSTNATNSTLSNSTTQDNSSTTTPSTTTQSSLDQYRVLMQNLIQYNQAQADYLCSQQTTYYVKQMISTSGYTTIIEKVPINSTVTTKTYYSSLDNTTAVLPLTSLINATQASTPTAQDICLQTTFYNINPMAGYTYTNETVRSSGDFIQVNTLTSSYKLLESANSPVNTTFQATFAYDFNNSALGFKNNQTVCMAYNYLNSTYVSTPWSTGSCQTIYNVDLKQMRCVCSSMGPSYYGIVTDTTRLLAVSPTVIITSNNSPQSFFAQFVNSGLAVIIFLLFFAIVGPIIALCLDSKSYSDLKKGSFDVSEGFMKQIATARHQPIEQLLYRQKALSEYKEASRINFCYIQGVLFKNLHPLINIFTKFDIEVKRMIRFMMILYQISIIAILTGIVFSPYYRRSEAQNEERLNKIDHTDLVNSLITGAVLSLVTLPWFYWFECCLKSKLVAESTLDEGDSKSPSKFSNISKQHVVTNRSQADDDEESGNKYTSQRAQTVEEDAQLKAKNGPPNSKNTVAVDEPIAAVDNCIPCKVILIIMSYVLCLAALIFVGVICSKVPKSQVIAIVIAFYLAVLGGWFVLNVIRIFFVSILAPVLVNSEEENEGQSACSSIFTCLIVPHEAKEIIRDIQAVYDITYEKEYETSPQQKEHSSNTQSNMKEQSPGAFSQKENQQDKPAKAQPKIKNVKEVKESGRSARYLEESPEISKKKNAKITISDDESN